MKQWIVIAVCDGDGASDYGNRVWSQVFTTLAAANAAADFIGKYIGKSTVIEDDRPIIDVAKVEA